jgi:hypothetical protein
LSAAPASLKLERPRPLSRDLLIDFCKSYGGLRPSFSQ